MARLPTTADAYNAIAEPARRRILAFLADGEATVGELADALELSQPQTSKHLKVLKEVGLVTVRKAGRQRIHALEAKGLKPVHDWLSQFERRWTERFDRLDSYLDELQKEDPHEP